MNFGAEEIHRIKQAKERNFSGCYKDWHGKRQNQVVCDDPFCQKLNKILDEIEPRGSNFFQGGPFTDYSSNCPCNLHKRTTILTATRRILKDYPLLRRIK